MLLISRGLTGLLVGANCGISKLYWVEVASSAGVKRKVKCRRRLLDSLFVIFGNKLLNDHPWPFVISLTGAAVCNGIMEFGGWVRAIASLLRTKLHWVALISCHVLSTSFCSTSLPYAVSFTRYNATCNCYLIGYYFPGRYCHSNFVIISSDQYFVLIFSQVKLKMECIRSYYRYVVRKIFRGKNIRVLLSKFTENIGSN